WRQLDVLCNDDTAFPYLLLPKAHFFLLIVGLPKGDRLSLISSICAASFIVILLVRFSMAGILHRCRRRCACHPSRFSRNENFSFLAKNSNKMPDSVS